MASNKESKTETYVEILERLLLLSKKNNLGEDYLDLISLLEDHINKELSESLSMKEDLAADSQYIALLQKELKQAKENQKEQDLPGELEQIKKELEESKFHAKQLEKGILYLRCKLDEAKTDRDLLNQELLQNRKEMEILRLQLEEARKNESEN